MCVAGTHGRPPSSNQVCAPGCRRASGRAEARTRSAWAKVKRELIEDVTRCNRPALRQERYETAAEMPDSTWIVVEGPLIGQRVTAMRPRSPSATQWCTANADLSRKGRAGAPRPRRPGDGRLPVRACAPRGPQHVWTLHEGGHASRPFGECRVMAWAHLHRQRRRRFGPRRSLGASEPPGRRVKLLDTSVAIDHLRGDQNAVALLTMLIERDEILAASEVVRFDVVGGVHDRRGCRPGAVLRRRSLGC